MLTIMTLNCNGIRAADRHGFFDWFLQEHTDVDVLCLQETKLALSGHDLYERRLPGYLCYACDAQKKGYSGVALYTKQEPKKIWTGVGDELLDSEGRIIGADFGDYDVVSAYFPSGTSGEARQSEKMRFLELVKTQYFDPAEAACRAAAWCGDWNIAHDMIDLKNWKSNQKNSGFLPEERAWLTALYEGGEGYWTDAYRYAHPEDVAYSWWTYRANARANNVGWRIDLQVVPKSWAERIVSARMYREPVFSDHGPVKITYDL